MNHKEVGMTKIIGITGGMASGKSTVASMIARDRYPHLDADALVHHLMAEDRDTIRAIGAAFPSAIVEGTASRAALSELIAQGVDVVPALEAILHPRIRMAEERAIELAQAQACPAVILDIPLLFETGAEELCDVVVAVAAPLEIRKARAFARTGMTEEKWAKLIARQLTDEQRAARADHVVTTIGSMRDTTRQVNALLAQWNLV